MCVIIDSSQFPKIHCLSPWIFQHFSLSKSLFILMDFNYLCFHFELNNEIFPKNVCFCSRNIALKPRIRSKYLVGWWFFLCFGRASSIVVLKTHASSQTIIECNCQQYLVVTIKTKTNVLWLLWWIFVVRKYDLLECSIVCYNIRL